MKKLIIIAAVALLTSCKPDKVYVVTVEYHNGDKVCKSFIGSNIWLDEGELMIRRGGVHRVLVSGVRDFEITRTGELTSK